MFWSKLFKKRTHKERIYRLLRDYEWHSFRELNRICFRYGARLWDLKQDGLDHEVITQNGIKLYRFKR